MVKGKWLESVMNWRIWIFPVILSILLSVVAEIDYLTFHTLVELFAIIISFIMFAFVWYSHDFSKNLILLYIACGYFWIGSLDLLHTLVYKGMDLFYTDNGNTAAQIWIATRYGESLLLLTAPFLSRRVQKKHVLVLIFGVIAISIPLLIFSRHFPIAFVENIGLTPFKIYSEYIIICIFSLALIAIFRFGEGILEEEKKLIALAIFMTICAEMAFTSYVSLYGTANLIGHIFKLFSFWFLLQAIIKLNLKKPHIALVEQQTYLKKALKDLEDQRYLLDEHALVLTTDPIGTIKYVNEKFCTTSGYTREELIGKNPRLFKSFVHPQAFYKELWRTISGGNVWHGEICNKAKNGTYYWLDSTIAPIYDDAGNIHQYVTIRTDITERRLLEHQLRQSQKMEAVGQITGGIAHDFNNILGIIMGNLEILKIIMPKDAKSLERVGNALAGVERGAKLTKKLLGFSRKKVYVTKLILINRFIENLMELISRSLTVSITIKTSLAENLWSVAIDPGDLEDAILNLALNARDAMPKEGTLLIETENKVLDKYYIDQNPGCKAGEYVMIAVSDTGSGMSQITQDRVLEPFYTTKDSEEGTGLGLSMVHGFIRRSGGHIKIYSELGKGSTFRLYIPRSLADDEQMNLNTDDQNIILRGSETILIVDDEEALCEAAEIHLSALGYSIITANNAGEALNIMENGINIDLLFSDIVMKGDMDGYELARVVLKKHPDIKILLTSGFTQNREKYLNSRS